MGDGDAHAQSHQPGISAALARGYARAVATARDRGRCRERLEQLTESSLDCESLQREAIVQLQGVIGYPVAAPARARNGASDAHALERAADWRWVMIEAARLEGEPDAQIALTLRAATPTETFDLLCRACALSSRERDVVAALLAGLDTRAVGARLCISPHTVQDHLKSVFEKTGGHSRPELLARFSGASDPMSRHG
jgi:DNA-binding CsgD family transcriptional regulator